MKFKFLTLKGAIKGFENVELTGEKMDLFGVEYLKIQSVTSKWHAWITVSEISFFTLHD